jgi:hypothetical protein
MIARPFKLYLRTESLFIAAAPLCGRDTVKIEPNGGRDNCSCDPSNRILCIFSKESWNATLGILIPQRYELQFGQLKFSAVHDSMFFPLALRYMKETQFWVLN